MRAGRRHGHARGLTLPVGEPAINPVPRQMMTTHLDALAAEHGYAGGFDVTIGVEGGEALALKTMNPRLGIVGGLSILGTTGIVRPFSCSAYIASIHQASTSPARTASRTLPPAPATRARTRCARTINCPTWR